MITGSARRAEGELAQFLNRFDNSYGAIRGFAAVIERMREAQAMLTTIVSQQGDSVASRGEGLFRLRKLSRSKLVDFGLNRARVISICRVGCCLEATDKIYRGPYDGKISSLGGADVAVNHCADVQRYDDLKRRLVDHSR